MAVFDVQAEILSNEFMSPGVAKLRLHAPEISATARPGQFVNVRCSSYYDPLLRRPLSIYRVGKTHDTIELVYKIVGRGTKCLSELPKGSRLEVLGPLGRGFTVNANCRNSILIGGGTGAASLMYLATELANLNDSLVHVLLGAHSEEEIPCAEDFRELVPRIRLTTWVTRYGLEQCLQELLPTLTPLDSMVYACGPTAMLRRVAELCVQSKIPCEVSLEAHMACGLGACQSCVCKTKTRSAASASVNNFTYTLVCQNGPVFNAEEVIWE